MAKKPRKSPPEVLSAIHEQDTPEAAKKRSGTHTNKRDRFAQKHGYNTMRLLATAMAIDGIFILIRRDRLDKKWATKFGYESIDALLNAVANGSFFEEFDIVRKNNIEKEG